MRWQTCTSSAVLLLVLVWCVDSIKYNAIDEAENALVESLEPWSLAGSSLTKPTSQTNEDVERNMYSQQLEFIERGEQVPQDLLDRQQQMRSQAQAQQMAEQRQLLHQQHEQGPIPISVVELRAATAAAAGGGGSGVGSGISNGLGSDVFVMPSLPAKWDLDFEFNNEAVGRWVHDIGASVSRITYRSKPPKPTATQLANDEPYDQTVNEQTYFFDYASGRMLEWRRSIPQPSTIEGYASATSTASAHRRRLLESQFPSETIPTTQQALTDAFNQFSDAWASWGLNDPSTVSQARQAVPSSQLFLPPVFQPVDPSVLDSVDQKRSSAYLFARTADNLLNAETPLAGGEGVCSQYLLNGVYSRMFTTIALHHLRDIAVDSSNIDTFLATTQGGLVNSVGGEVNYISVRGNGNDGLPYGLTATKDGRILGVSAGGSMWTFAVHSSPPALKPLTTADSWNYRPISFFDSSTTDFLYSLPEAACTPKGDLDLGAARRLQPFIPFPLGVG